LLSDKIDIFAGGCASEADSVLNWVEDAFNATSHASAWSVDTGFELDGTDDYVELNASPSTIAAAAGHMTHDSAHIAVLIKGNSARTAYVIGSEASGSKVRLLARAGTVNVRLQSAVPATNVT